MSQPPAIVSKTPLDSSSARWVQLQRIDWTDQTGKSRIWEVASRKTRGSSGIDAVAIAPILIHKNLPPSTLVILQYRPPVASICVEFPAGLIDEGETAESAAIRELKEETGFVDARLVESSPVIVSDPGMTVANMKLVVVEVDLKDGDLDESVEGGVRLPDQQLEEGEFIERVVVPLEGLHKRLVGFSEEGKFVDARLFHWAAGLEFARKVKW